MKLNYEGDGTVYPMAAYINSFDDDFSENSSSKSGVFLSMHKTPKKTRKNFPETWIWEEVSPGYGIDLDPPSTNYKVT